MSNVQWAETISNDATTEQTLENIVKRVNIDKLSPFAIEAAEILRQASDGSQLDFLETMFSWACRNIDYKLDGDSHAYPDKDTEVLATPDLTVRNGISDCKKYSILQGSILAAAGIEPIFKWVEYADDTAWTHIYVIVPGADFDARQRSTYIVLDPTNDCKFNEEVKYKSATLYYLNGTTMKLQGMGGRQLSNANMMHHTWGKDLGIAGSNVLDRMKMGQSSGAVNHKWLAFLTLVTQNVGGLATMLLAACSINPNSLDTYVSQYGGNVYDLKEAILTGSALPAIPYPVKYDTAEDNLPVSGPNNVAVASGNLNARWSAVGGVAGSYGSMIMQPLSTIPYHIVNANKPASGAALIFLNQVNTAIKSGQTFDGYYGFFDSNGTAFWGPSADAELRSAYNECQTWWGANSSNTSNITPPLPMPLAKGAAITQSGGNSNTTLGISTITNLAGSYIKDMSNMATSMLNATGGKTANAGGVIDGLASGVGQAAGLPVPLPGTTGNTNTQPFSLPPPKVTSIAGSIGGFIFKTVLVMSIAPKSLLIVVPAILLYISISKIKKLCQLKKQ